MTPQSVCTDKHTAYQPSDDEFKCPKCGATAGEFYIETEAEASTTRADCALVHPDDVLLCTKCGYGVSGKAFAAAIMKKKNLVPCPHCHGRGTIPGPKK